jgi:hypothetical protein
VKGSYPNDLILSAIEEETMESFQPKFILCPTDFSELATQALYYGKKMAVCFDARLIVLGAQHKRFYDTTVIGTTTVRVTRHAPCPVLTVIRK